MTLKELKSHFRTTLDATYPKEEIESFYYLLIEDLLNLKRINIALDPLRVLSEMEEHCLLYTSDAADE